MELKQLGEKLLRKVGEGNKALKFNTMQIDICEKQNLLRVTLSEKSIRRNMFVLNLHRQWHLGVREMETEKKRDHSGQRLA